MFGSKPAVRPEHRREAVPRVQGSRKFTVGARNEQEISELEPEWAEFCDIRYAVAVNSGIAALELALTTLGIQPGDEVIVPALSHVATAMAPLYQPAVPVFADIGPVSWCRPDCRPRARWSR